MKIQKKYLAAVGAIGVIAILGLALTLNQGKFFSGNSFSVGTLSNMDATVKNYDWARLAPSLTSELFTAVGTDGNTYQALVDSSFIQSGALSKRADGGFIIDVSKLKADLEANNSDFTLNIKQVSGKRFSGELVAPAPQRKYTAPKPAAALPLAHAAVSEADKVIKITLASQTDLAGFFAAMENIIGTYPDGDDYTVEAYYTDGTGPVIKTGFSITNSTCKDVDGFILDPFKIEHDLSSTPSTQYVSIKPFDRLDNGTQVLLTVPFTDLCKASLNNLGANDKSTKLRIEDINDSANFVEEPVDYSATDDGMYFNNFYKTDPDKGIGFFYDFANLDVGGTIGKLKTTTSYKFAIITSAGVITGKNSLKIIDKTSPVEATVPFSYEKTDVKNGDNVDLVPVMIMNGRKENIIVTDLKFGAMVNNGGDSSNPATLTFQANEDGGVKARDVIKDYSMAVKAGSSTVVDLIDPLSDGTGGDIVFSGLTEEILSGRGHGFPLEGSVLDSAKFSKDINLKYYLKEATYKYSLDGGVTYTSEKVLNNADENAVNIPLITFPATASTGGIHSSISPTPIADKEIKAGDTNLNLVKVRITNDTDSPVNVTKLRFVGMITASSSGYQFGTESGISIKDDIIQDYQYTVNSTSLLSTVKATMDDVGNITFDGLNETVPQHRYLDFTLVGNQVKSAAKFGKDVRLKYFLGDSFYDSVNTVTPNLASIYSTPPAVLPVLTIKADVASDSNIVVNVGNTVGNHTIETNDTDGLLGLDIKNGYSANSDFRQIKSITFGSRITADNKECDGVTTPGDCWEDGKDSSANISVSDYLENFRLDTGYKGIASDLGVFNSSTGDITITFDNLADIRIPAATTRQMRLTGNLKQNGPNEDANVRFYLKNIEFVQAGGFVNNVTKNVTPMLTIPASSSGKACITFDKYAFTPGKVTYTEGGKTEQYSNLTMMSGNVDLGMRFDDVCQSSVEAAGDIGGKVPGISVEIVENTGKASVKDEKSIASEYIPVGENPPFNGLEGFLSINLVNAADGKPITDMDNFKGKGYVRFNNNFENREFSLNGNTKLEFGKKYLFLLRGLHIKDASKPLSVNNVEQNDKVAAQYEIILVSKSAPTPTPTPNPNPTVVSGGTTNTYNYYYSNSGEKVGTQVTSPCVVTINGKSETFSDIQSGSSYCKAMANLASEGVLKTGQKADTPLVRYTAALSIRRALVNAGVTFRTSRKTIKDFRDYSQLKTFSAQEIADFNSAISSGILKGNGDGELLPLRQMKYAEFFVAFAQAIESATGKSITYNSKEIPSFISRTDADQEWLRKGWSVAADFGLIERDDFRSLDEYLSYSTKADLALFLDQLDSSAVKSFLRSL